jgi:hypothetical protein
MKKLSVLAIIVGGALLAATPTRFSNRLKRTWCYPLTVLMPE